MPWMACDSPNESDSLVGILICKLYIKSMVITAMVMANPWYRLVTVAWMCEDGYAICLLFVYKMIMVHY